MVPATAPAALEADKPLERLRALLDEEADQRFQAYQELEAEARVRHYLKNFTLGFRLGMGLEACSIPDEK